MAPQRFSSAPPPITRLTELGAGRVPAASAVCVEAVWDARSSAPCAQLSRSSAQVSPTHRVARQVSSRDAVELSRLVAEALEAEVKRLAAVGAPRRARTAERSSASATPASQRATPAASPASRASEVRFNWPATQPALKVYGPGGTSSPALELRSPRRGPSTPPTVWRGVPAGDKDKPDASRSTVSRASSAPLPRSSHAASKDGASVDKAVKVETVAGAAAAVAPTGKHLGSSATERARSHRDVSPLRQAWSDARPRKPFPRAASPGLGSDDEGFSNACIRLQQKLWAAREDRCGVITV